MLPNKNSTELSTATGTAKSGGRIASVEFIRVALCSLLILFHGRFLFGPFLQDLFHSTRTFFENGRICVECFFIIGGFFLLKNMEKHEQQLADFAKKMYVRLMPCLLLVTLVFVAAGWIKTRLLIDCIFLIPGPLTNPQVLSLGSWFVCAYFWVMLLYFTVLQMKSQIRWAIVLGLVYVALSLQRNGPLVGNVWDGLYFGWLGAGMVRAIGGIGLGILVAAVHTYFHSNGKWIVRCGLTLLEVFAIVELFRYSVHTTSHANVIEVQLIFGLLLLLSTCAGQAGYISSWFNRQQWIVYASRYTYAVFIIQMLSYKLLKSWRLGPIPSLVLGFAIPVVLGMLEYHIIEKKVVPLVWRYIKPSAE